MTEWRLLLLRHAKSSWDDPDLSDHDRPLSKRGREVGELLRAMFRERAIRPDLVLVSSARRAVETLEALQPWESPPRVDVLSALYHAPAPALLEIIRAAPDFARVLLVIGHNPGLQDFAVSFAGRRDDALVQRMAEGYPTGAFAQFEVERPRSRIEMGCAKLTDFVTPKELGRARRGA
jgi:phosphohistidine phosphatase